ncbi:MAG: hypothetical protein IMZ55_09270 [Acidobacteria bacterium]|nr:hypothetical protein [Planctomycetota bacterium]MBE3133652.1 hypothetical protein [Acidobacteriota bacterium]
MASVYSRAQAIADGVLIDVTPLAKSEGFRLHTVMTCGVVAEVKAQVEKVFSDVMAFVEKEAVYWAALKDVLQALHEAIRQQKESTDTIHFKHAGLDLWSLVGPGDTAAPVLTIMLEGED